MKLAKTILLLTVLVLIAPAVAYKGGHHMGHGTYKSLSKEQRIKLIKLGIAHKKSISAERVKKSRLNTELALLITIDKPNKVMIAKKVNQIVEIKKALLNARVGYRIAIRAILTIEQRRSFDMRILAGAIHSKKSCRRYRGHHKGHHGYHKKHYGHHPK